MELGKLSFGRLSIPLFLSTNDTIDLEGIRTPP